MEKGQGASNRHLCHLDGDNGTICVICVIRVNGDFEYSISTMVVLWRPLATIGDIGSLGDNGANGLPMLTMRF